MNKFMLLKTYVVSQAAASTTVIDSDTLNKTFFSSFLWVFKSFWPYILLLIGLSLFLNMLKPKRSRKKKRNTVTYSSFETGKAKPAKAESPKSKADPLKSRIKGIVGESSVFIILESLPSEYKPMHNVMLETARGTSQIDHVVVSPYGVFAIETKNYKGWIYGKEDDYYWTQVLSGNKNRFYSPIKQNEGHINALKRIIGDVPCHSIVVFSGNCELKSKPQGVFYERELQSAIMAYKNPVLTQEQVRKIESAIFGENIIDRESREGHVENLRSRYRR